MNGHERQVDLANIFICSLDVKQLTEYKFLRSYSYVFLSP